MVKLPLLSPQQFGIWLESSSPEQTVPYLWNEETPASKHPHQASLFAFWTHVLGGFAAREGDAAKTSHWPL